MNLFEQFRTENNRSQFMKYLMLELYNDDEQHGDIERPYRKENFNKWGKNYLFSMLRFHALEQCGNFRDMSLQLYGNENFVTFRKFGNKIFMNMPMPQACDRRNKILIGPKVKKKNRPMKNRVLVKKAICKDEDKDEDELSDEDEKDFESISKRRMAKTKQKCRFNSSEEDSDDNDKRCRKIASKCRRDQTMGRYHSKKKSNEL